MTDPIADMLIRIRNAQAVKKDTVQIPFSHIKYQIAKVLEQRKFIKGIELKGRKTKKVLELALKYDKEQESAIIGLKRISKPGLRTYAAAQKIRRVRSGQGIAILSTSAGIMSDSDARRKNVGGEVLCEIW
ncbi:30S ribosomal protein S8 [Patescibacteria group bacterium]|nr:30S ribosomal protein S8 [Patescibacteria group bacterium]